MTDVLDRKLARQTDSDFIVAAARAIYCDWYLSDPKREARVTGPGVELTGVIPHTQRWAFDRARKFAVDLCDKLGEQSLEALLKSWEPIWNGDRDFTEENAGWYAAMGAMGHGVSLYDAGRIEVNYPYLSSDL